LCNDMPVWLTPGEGNGVGFFAGSLVMQSLCIVWLMVMGGRSEVSWRGRGGARALYTDSRIMVLRNFDGRSGVVEV